jgi:hypothetical protein
MSMKVASSAKSVAIIVVAYAYASYAAYLAFGPSSLPVGYRYLVLLVATLLLLAAHGLRLINRSQIQRLFKNRQTLQSTPSEAVMAGWEILFGWLGLTCALVFLYYAAPAAELAAWYPRLFLCLSVLFVAAFRRTLIFLATILPFVATITLLALWQDLSTGAVGEAASTAVFLVLDGALLYWAARLARACGIFSINEFEMPLGPGRVGDRLTGFVRTQSSHFPENGYQLDLTCIRQSKSGKQQATGEVLHHIRKTVRGDRAGARYSGCSIPVEFEIPASAAPTAASDGSRTKWMLSASAELSDSAFETSFEVPVEEADSKTLHASSERIDVGPGAHAPQPVTVGSFREGAVVFRTGSDWNASGELLTAAYFCFWCQLVWLSTVEALGWPTIAMFAVGLFFLAGLLWPLGTRVITELRDSVLHTQRRELWRTQVDTVAGPLVSEVTVARSGLRAGLIEARPCYDVVVKTQAGRRLTAGTQFRERRTAEATAAELKSVAVEQTRLVGKQLALETQGI